MWVQKQQKHSLQAPSAAEPVSTCRLSMYSSPPDEQVSIEEFEAFAIDRLKVLKGLENNRARGFKFPQLQERARELVSKNLLADKSADSHRKDIISHYVLRLAYCRTEDLRRWFITQECDLFRFRFSLEAPSSQAAFMHQNDLPFEMLEPSELEEAKAEIIQVLNSLGQKEVAADVMRGPTNEMFYKVPWEQVPDLVATWRCVLRNGFAYVHKREMGSLVLSHFKTRLSRALSLTARKWVTHVAAEESMRLTPVVESLSMRYLGPDFTEESNISKEAISAQSIPTLAKTSFPLCMANMYHHLHQDHHLRHGGRQQLGLFLKGIGLPLEQAMQFWRAEFAPKTSGDAFEKQYAYNIRYNYGKEGKRTDFTPYSCVKIVSSTPGQADYHGCPYKTWSADQLSATLSQMKLGNNVARDVVQKAKAGHYQIACGLAFEGFHGCSCDSGINHPNQEMLCFMPSNFKADLVSTEMKPRLQRSSPKKFIRSGPRLNVTYLQYFLESRKVLKAKSEDEKSEQKEPSKN